MTATVKQISSFLDKHLTDFEIARIVEHCQIQNMKENRCTNWTYVDEQMKTDKRFGTFINTGISKLSLCVWFNFYFSYYIRFNLFETKQL